MEKILITRLMWGVDDKESLVDWVLNVLEKGCSVVGGKASVEEIVFVSSKKRLRSLRCG